MSNKTHNETTHYGNISGILVSNDMNYFNLLASIKNFLSLFN